MEREQYGAVDKMLIKPLLSSLGPGLMGFFGLIRIMKKNSSKKHLFFLNEHLDKYFFISYICKVQYNHILPFRRVHRLVDSSVLKEDFARAQ
jgi:hypothetical protein